MNYCHQHKIMHRDLKPQNIMLDRSKDFNNIKIVDFGISRKYKAYQEFDE